MLLTVSPAQSSELTLTDEETDVTCQRKTRREASSTTSLLILSQVVVSWLQHRSPVPGTCPNLGGPQGQSVNGSVDVTWTGRSLRRKHWNLRRSVPPSSTWRRSTQNVSANVTATWILVFTLFLSAWFRHLSREYVVLNVRLSGGNACCHKSIKGNTRRSDG